VSSGLETQAGRAPSLDTRIETSFGTGPRIVTERSAAAIRVVDWATGEVLGEHEPDRLVDVGPEPKPVRDRDRIWGAGREDKPGVLVRELPDVVAARYRPWRKWKAKALVLAKAYQDLGDDRRASLVRNCGRKVVFQECPNGHEKRLARAWFCRDRLCPLCQWRRSLVHREAVRKVLAAVEKAEPVRYVFLTLTVPNVDEDDLRPTLDRMVAAVQAWAKTPEWSARVRGFVRSLEVTVNRDDLTFHPHMHLVLAVPDGPDGYFHGRRKGPLFWEKKEWQAAWQAAVGLPLAIVDVRAVWGMAAAAAEVTKYETKPAGILRGTDPNGTAWAVGVVAAALRKRRMVEWGGVLRVVRQRLLKARQVQDPDAADADLVHVDADAKDSSPALCTLCGAGLVETHYYWDFEVFDYVLQRGAPRPDQGPPGRAAEPDAPGSQRQGWERSEHPEGLALPLGGRVG